MKEIHRTEIVITFRREILIRREEHTDLSRFPAERTPVDGVNRCQAEIDSIERRRVLHEAIQALLACLDQGPV